MNKKQFAATASKTFTQLVAEHDAKVRKSIERKKKPKSKKK